MGSDVKPRTADGYRLDVTEACERTLLTLLTAFGTLKDTLRLVGGLVPRYLTPATPPEVPFHAGTSDVDVVLDLQLLGDGEQYASLSAQLKARGFERHLNDEGNPVSWRWKRKVDDRIEVFVELLRDAGDLEPGKPVSVEGEKVSAMCFKYAGITADWYCEKRVTAYLLDDEGRSTECVRFADVPAFVILKALAFNHRRENKDAADLIHVVRYAGTLEHVASLFVTRIQSGQHPQAIEEGLAALRSRFCDDEDGVGFEKTGPVAYAKFHDIGDDEARAANQRFASGYITALLEKINDQLRVACARSPQGGEAVPIE